MRVKQITTIARLCLTQSANTAIHADCVSALNSISPRKCIENVQRQACKVDCRPRPEHWDNFGTDTMHELVEDGAVYLRIDEGKEAFVAFLESIFQDIRTKCGVKLERGHNCQNSPQLDEAMKCVDDYSRLAKISAAPRLLPCITADRRKKVADYSQSSELWENSFPARGKNYVIHYHEL